MEGGIKGPMSKGWGIDTLPYDLSHDACDVTYPPEKKDTCENITFPQLPLQAVKKRNFTMAQWMKNTGFIEREFTPRPKIWRI